MDAFYASVEQVDNPRLKGKPVIVGGTVKQRGVVAAASYEARKFGIHSAMPTSQAVRLCPDVILLPVRMERYSQLSKQIFKIFYDYTPQIEQISLDEAFLDVTASLSLFGSAEEIGREIKDRIKNELGLTASVGTAPNKFLAKLASDLEKPDGFVVITDENKQKILDPLAVSKIWGIGKVTSRALNENGIKTIEQLRKTPLKILRNILGSQADDFLQLAKGIDERPVEPDREPKSISAEETFPADIIDKDFLLKVLFDKVEEVGRRLREEKLEGKTITLKLRYKDFKTITRSYSFDYPANVTNILWQRAREVFEKWYDSSAGQLRLLGFEVSGLVRENLAQKLLFSDSTNDKHKKIDDVFDKIKKKFGDNSLKRG